MHDLARRIIAIEAARAKAAKTRVDQAVRACETLQAPLSRLAGPAGFWSLLSRALTLAKAEVPALRVVQIQPEGILAGFDEIKPDEDTRESGGVVLLTHLLGLLATLIGETLTLRLVCDAWADASIGCADLKREEKP